MSFHETSDATAEQLLKCQENLSAVMLRLDNQASEIIALKESNKEMAKALEHSGRSTPVPNPSAMPKNVTKNDQAQHFPTSLAPPWRAVFLLMGSATPAFYISYAITR